MERSRLWWMAIGVLLIFVWWGPASGHCLDGTSVAVYQHDGPYKGFYLYTIELEFMLEKGLSNVSLKLNVEECPDLACQQFFLFPSPAGHMSGNVASCPVPFIGEYNCRGNPSIGLDVPVVKWDAGYVDGCEPGALGTITLYFYTNVGPDPESRMPFLLIKNGQEVCEGVLIGDTPGPACMVPTRDKSWGAIKSIYE